jgi:hypothetical protein
VDENDLCYNETVTRQRSRDKRSRVSTRQRLLQKKEKKTHSTYTYNQDRSNTTLNIRKMRCDSTNGQKRETYSMTISRQRCSEIMHRSHVFCTTTSHFSWYTVLCCFCPSHVSTSSVLHEGVNYA